MYGDDVFSEYGHSNDNNNDEDDANNTSSNSITGSGRKKKDDKLSNKAKRKLAKEVEAKEREAEFNLLAMKRSIEGNILIKTRSTISRLFNIIKNQEYHIIFIYSAILISNSNTNKICSNILYSIAGAQFAVSQSIIDPNDPQWQNALDIIIPR